jgi:hypothetical protein
MVFGVLRQIAVRAGIGNLLDDARPLDCWRCLSSFSSVE